MFAGSSVRSVRVWLSDIVVVGSVFSGKAGRGESV